MRVRLDDTNHLDGLIAFLERAGYTIVRLDDREIMVAPVPRSRRLEMVRLDLDLQLRAWEAAHPGVSVIRVTSNTE
jgi:hypothetical protein